MTYIESALGDFVKTILTRGVRTLKSPRFLPYTLFLLFIVAISTVTGFYGSITKSAVPTDLQNLMLYTELGAALAFIVVGIFLGRVNLWVQLLVMVAIIAGTASFFYYKVLETINGGDSLTTALATSAVLYIIWIGIMTFSTFSLFRDLFANNVFGMIMFLGKPEDDGKVMFSYLAWFIVIINIILGYFIYHKHINSAYTFTGFIIIVTALVAIVPLLGIQDKHDVFFTILTAFFMFSTIRVIILAFKVITAGSGSTSIWETIFSLFMALYAVQGATVKGIKIGKKTQLEVDEDDIIYDQLEMPFTQKVMSIISDRGIVLVILGVLLGFHTMQVSTLLERPNIFANIAFTKNADIVLLGYQMNILVTFVIYLLSMVFFFFFPPFTRYADPEVKRFPWAPPYDDLKQIWRGISTGEISWKADVGKMAIGLIKGKLVGKFTGKGSSEEVVQDTVSKLLRKSKQVKDDK